MSDSPDCSHMDQIHDVSPDATGCSQCITMGDTWVHLRMCLSCGSVGCCDSSKNTHATKHFQSTSHPIIRSQEPGEGWIYCFVDDIAMELQN